MSKGHGTRGPIDSTLLSMLLSSPESSFPYVPDEVDRGNDILAMPAIVPSGRDRRLSPRQSKLYSRTRPDTIVAGLSEAIPAIPGGATRIAPDPLSTRARKGLQAVTFLWPRRWPNGRERRCPRCGTTCNLRPIWHSWRLLSHSIRHATSTLRRSRDIGSTVPCVTSAARPFSRPPGPSTESLPRRDRLGWRSRADPGFSVPYPPRPSAPSWKTSRRCRRGSASSRAFNPRRFRHIYLEGKTQEEAAALIGCSPPTLSRIHKDAIASIQFSRRLD